MASKAAQKRLREIFADHMLEVLDDPGLPYIDAEEVWVLEEIGDRLEFDIWDLKAYDGVTEREPRAWEIARLRQIGNEETVSGAGLLRRKP